MREKILALAAAALFAAAAETAAYADVIVAGGGSGETAVSLTGPSGQTAYTDEISGTEDDVDFDVDQFVLPEEAAVLVIVEGTGGSDCMVYAYEKEDGEWQRRVETYGYLGENGMSNLRTSGDKTTPIGLFPMNTPFGQKEALEGFPENYIQTTISHVWRDSTNKLVDDISAYGDGEAVGTFWYAGYYDYAIDSGFNINGIAGQGSALFLHCIGQDKTYTSGCVAIPTEEMIAVMRLYGAHGDGACYIAQAPEGTFDLVYDTYGVNDGLSPDGDFT